MPDPKIGTREEWQSARGELAKLEAEHAKLGELVARRLPLLAGSDLVFGHLSSSYQTR